MDDRDEHDGRTRPMPWVQREVPRTGTQIMSIQPAIAPAPPTSAPSSSGPPSYPYPPFRQAEWRPPLEDVEPADRTRVAPEGGMRFEEEAVVLSVRVDDGPRGRLRRVDRAPIGWGAVLAALGGWVSFVLDAPLAISLLLMTAALAGGAFARTQSRIPAWAAIGLSAFWLGLVIAAWLTSWIAG